MKKLISIRLEPEVLKKVKTLAKKQGRSFSNLINFILSKATDKADSP